MGVDRISELPDELALHILSFLRTTEVVRTCVLSKRWSSMWLYVRTLRFDYQEFDSPNLNELKNFLKFQLFVHSVLLNHKAEKLDRIIIKSLYDHSHNPAAVRMWICHALRRNPRVFTIVYDGSSKLHMPQSIFTCASLEVLGFQLASDEGLEFVRPKIINLPRLRSLWVGRVALGEEFMNTFFSACPFLEVLDLLECDIGFSDIYSQKLQSLIIERCYVKKMLCISTPNLDYLEICFRKETIAKGVVLQEMGSLYEADFSFELDIANIPREFVLLSKISNVTSLRLGGSGVVLKVWCHMFLWQTVVLFEASFLH